MNVVTLINGKNTEISLSEFKDIALRDDIEKVKEYEIHMVLK